MDDKTDLESKMQEQKEELSNLEKENKKLKKTVKKQQDMLEELKHKNERSDDKIDRKVTEGFVGDISVIRESIEKAVESAEEGCRIESGLDSTIDKIDKMLSDREVRVIKPEKGSHFNADLHEIVETVENDEYEDNIIVDFQSPGFMYDGTVIEYAKVTVSSSEN